MDPAHIRTRIWTLLDAIKADFPRRKQEAEALMSKLGPYDPLEMAISQPERYESIPTFVADVKRKPTQMLRARFDYAGTWDTGWYCWLAPADMAKWMRKQSVKVRHKALRQHHDGSAPLLFPDNQLTLYGITPEVPDVLIYLVWKDELHEPEIWSYDSYDFHHFDDLEKYLQWYLARP